MQAVLYHHGAPHARGLLKLESRERAARLKLPAAAREQLTIALSMIDAIDLQLAPFDLALRAYARKQPGCRTLTDEIYGTGELTSVTILPELGDTRHRRLTTSEDRSMTPAASRPPVGITAMHRTAVAQAMHPGIMACSPTAQIEEVAQIMTGGRVDCVTVVDHASDHSPVVSGVVSDIDLLMWATGGDTHLPTGVRRNPLGAGRGPSPRQHGEENAKLVDSVRQLRAALEALTRGNGELQRKLL